MSTDVFELEIVKKFESQKISVVWVEVDSPTGNFIVGPDHSPLVSLLKYRGKVTYKDYHGKEFSFDTYAGIFLFDQNKATIIMD